MLLLCIYAKGMLSSEGEGLFLVHTGNQTSDKTVVYLPKSKGNRKLWETFPLLSPLQPPTLSLHQYIYTTVKISAVMSSYTHSLSLSPKGMADLFGHVQDGLQLVFLEVTVGQGRHPQQQKIEPK